MSYTAFVTRPRRVRGRHDGGVPRCALRRRASWLADPVRSLLACDRHHGDGSDVHPSLLDVLEVIATSGATADGHPRRRWSRAVRRPIIERSDDEANCPAVVTVQRRDRIDRSSEATGRGCRTCQTGEADGRRTVSPSTPLGATAASHRPARSTATCRPEAHRARTTRPRGIKPDPNGVSGGSARRRSTSPAPTVPGDASSSEVASRHGRARRRHGHRQRVAAGRSPCPTASRAMPS